MTPVIEGKGLIAPGPVGVPITRGNVLALLPIALAQSAKYRNGRTLWRRGIVTKLPGEWGLGSLVPPHAVPTLIAKTGEWAFVEMVNHRLKRRVCELDVAVRDWGDGGIDVRALGYTFQVKTDRGSWSVGLVRRVSADRNLIPMESDIHIFARWTGESRIFLLGWMRTRDVRGCPVEPAKRGEHWNLEVPYTRLEPMGRLIELLANKGRQEWH